jgi:adenine deaminase
MSDAPWEDVVAALSGVNAAAAALGCTLPAPFTTLAFVGLAGVGDLGLTERGLVDVAAQALTPAVLPVLDGRPACRCPDHRDAVHQLFDPAGAAS